MRFPTTKVVQAGGPGGKWQFRVIDPRTGAVEEVSPLYDSEDEAADVGVYLLEDLLSSAHNRDRSAKLLRRWTRV